MRNRNRGIVLCVLAVFCAAAMTGCGTKTVKENDTVMEVAGQHVVKAEYQMIVGSYAAQVKAEYTTDEANRKDFWTMETGNGTPLETIMKLAQEDLIYKKTVARLAKDAGIETETEYVSMMKDMERENSRRQNGEGKEGIVYGLTSFTPEDYYRYVCTQTEMQLIEKLKQNYNLTEKELKQIYQENIENYISDVSVRVLAAEMQAEMGMDQAQEVAEELGEETDLEGLTRKYPNVNFYELEMSSLNTQEGKTGAYAQRWLVASSMEQGQVCDPFEIGEHLMVMRCLDREEHREEPYQTVKGVLENDVLTSMAKEEIQQCAEGAEVDFQKETLEQAALEVLN